MRNVFFLLVLICGTVALIGSCAVEDDETTTNTGVCSADCAVLVAASTASGSITVGSETLSGTYATSCYTAGISDLVSSGSVPSDTKSVDWLFVVRGNDNITEEFQGFTDSHAQPKVIIPI